MSKTNYIASMQGMLILADRAKKTENGTNIDTALGNKLNVTGDNGTQAGVSALINKLTAGDSVPSGDDCYVSEIVNGAGSTNSTYHRRPIKYLWSYIKDQISSVLGLTSSSYGGKAATAGTADSANSVAWGNVSSKPTSYTPSAHADSTGSYGKGTKTNYGHVILVTGDMNGASDEGGAACSKNHTHSQYVPTSRTVNGHALTGNVSVTAADVSAVRYDTNSQGLNDTQKSNARTNIGAGTSNLTIGTTSSTAAAGDHNHNSIYVSGVSISGNYLQVTKNGSNTNLTVPYASRAANANDMYTYYTYVGYCDASSYRYWCVHKRGSLSDKEYAQGVFTVFLRTGTNAFKSYNVSFVVYRSGSSWSGKITKQIVGDSDSAVSVKFDLYRDASSGSTSFGIYAEISATTGRYLAGWTTRTCVSWMDTPTSNNTGVTANTATGAQVSTISSS